MKISQDGIDLIKRFEGFSASPYLDAVGYPTIGYGHCLRDGESFTAISREEAETLLKQDVAVAERAVHRSVRAPLTQHQFDALVSFVYNVGVEAFEKSTLLKLLREGNKASAALEFNRWVYAKGRKLPGLEIRRKAESRLFSQEVS